MGRSSRERRDHAHRQSCNTAIASFARAAEPGTGHQPQDRREMASAGDGRGPQDGAQRNSVDRVDWGRGAAPSLSEDTPCCRWMIVSTLCGLPSRTVHGWRCIAVCNVKASRGCRKSRGTNQVGRSSSAIRLGSFPSTSRNCRRPKASCTVSLVPGYAFAKIDLVPQCCGL